MVYREVGTMAAVVVAIASVAGLMAITDWEDMHTPVIDTVSLKDEGWEGWGQYPDLPGDERQHGEIFDATRYFTSYDAQGNSEKIIVRGTLKPVDVFHCVIGKLAYYFYIWDGSGDKTIDGVDGWSILKTDDLPDGKFVRDAPNVVLIGGKYDDIGYDLKLDGLYVDGATIKVRFRIYCTGLLNKGWYGMAVDEARLIRGDGDMTWGRDVYTVGKDQNAKLSWFVPAIQSDINNETAYKIFVTNENTGAIIYEEYVGDRSGSVNIPITEDMAEAGGSNRLIARLWNAIFQKDVTHVPVRISGGFHAPSDDPLTEDDFPKINSITTDRGEYREGDVATISINATAGRYPIDYYFLLCEIEGTEVVNVETTATSYQVQLSVAGIVECEATAYDIYGNPSSKRTVKATVTNAVLEDYCDKHPDDPACKVTEPGLDWLEILIIILLTIILFLVIGLEFWGLGQLGLDNVYVILGIIGLTLLIGLILIGLKIQEYMVT